MSKSGYLPLRATLPVVLVVLCSLALSCTSDYRLTGARPDVDPGDVTQCPFVPIEGTRLSSYECNPVFTNTDEGWGGDVGSVGFHVTEVLGHPFYQMWYTSSPGGYGNYGMGYAVSADGTDWETDPGNPLFGSETGAWDQDSFAGQVVVWDPLSDEYVMAYQGFNLGNQQDPADDVWGLGISTSVDGREWVKHPANPVIDFTDYEISENELLFDILILGNEPSIKIKPCWPLTMTINDRGAFRGYLAASRWSDVIDQMNGLSATPAGCDIYSMAAIDSGTWIIDEDQPVLSGSELYDAKGVTAAAVAELGGVQYMFYVGFEEWYEDPGTSGLIAAQGTTLNLATSEDDGMTWVKDPGNPLPVNLTTPGEVSNIGAQVIGSRIHLWVGDNYDGAGSIGYFYYEPTIGLHPASAN
ncbi:MAG: hypothetical protein CMP23_11620 [Rickettsiales bacterium]|nr:hypothetical protein [Rickettsiales bacterium]|tara:strand:+ start:3555 stop:4793 length:1239 start_codon:yes stop_codon:yes gene_type:complete